MNTGLPNSAGLPNAALDGRAGERVWHFDWVTPIRCRILLVLVLAFGFLSHLRYLTDDCPLDLSGDEAHYWDWSRQLDWSYYSKGPLVAYIIRASCTVFGDEMWAVRLPALILAAGTGLVTYLLTLKLFGSDRLALGAVLMNVLVPMFIAGSVLMTIDPPMFFCWTLATYLLALALFDGRRWPWPLIGVVVGVGFLAKYAMLLWLPTMLLVLWMDRRGDGERKPAGWGPTVAIGIALVFTLPVILWNAWHGWVSLCHVSVQTGAHGDARFSPATFIEFVGGQLGVLGPGVAAMMIGGCVFALRGTDQQRWGSSNRRAVRFLLWTGLPFLSLTAITSLRTKVQPNWPAPAYFSLLILTAYFLATRLSERRLWRPWRWWFYPTVAFALVVTPLLHHPDIAYGAIPWFNGRLDTLRAALERHPDNSFAAWLRHRVGDDPLTARKADFTARLRGWAELGGHVSSMLREMDSPAGPAFVLCDDYQKTAETAFYVDGQPRTYYAGSYFAEPRRLTQYDMWPDRSLDPRENPALLGRNAVYVGYMRPDIHAAFERVERANDLTIARRGVPVVTFRCARCYGFKGMTRPGKGVAY